MLSIKPFLYLLLAATALLAAGPARAQDLCDTPRESIVTPYRHRFGVPTVWDASHHMPGHMVTFGAGLPLETGGVLSWGTARALKDPKKAEMLLVELNRRGRAITLKTRPALAGEEPIALIAGGRNYIAASTVQTGKDGARRQTRLSWYDENADYRRELILRDDTFDYVPHALVPAFGGKGFIAVLHAVNHRNAVDNNAVLLRYGADGKLLWRRAYRPGAANNLQNMIPLADGTYLATGSIDGEGGRKAGWVLKLAADGAIVWQRTYPRGATAQIKYAAAQNNGLMLLGEVRGYDEGADAVWLLALTASGDMVWQRYFRRDDFDLSAFGLLSQGDGRFTVGANARARAIENPRNDHRSHIRLFTVAANGVLIDDEAYIDGLSAAGVQILRGGENERVVIANMQSDARPQPPTAQLATALEQSATPAEERTNPPLPAEIEQEGWVFVATPLETYDDPCHKAGQAKAN